MRVAKPIEIWIYIVSAFVSRAMFKDPLFAIGASDGEVTPEGIKLFHCGIELGAKKLPIPRVFVVLNDGDEML